MCARKITSPTPLIQSAIAKARSSPSIFQLRRLHAADQHPELEIDQHSITNRAHWSSKIHNLCAIDGNVDEALRLLDHLRLHGYTPENLNISTIIHALCNARRYPEAHRAVSAHHSVLDQRTCNVIIARFLDSGSPESTLRVIQSLFLEKPDFVPSLMNYNRLVDQFCGLSRMRDAHKVFDEMRERGHCPDVVSYTTLICGYCRAGEIDLAWKLFDEMSSRGVRPNPITYSVLIRAVLRTRDVEKGKELILKLWAVMGGEEDVHVNNAAFCNVIDCLCREGLFHEVFKIAEEMPFEKSVVEEFAYAQMIDSLCRYRRYNGGARIVYVMRKRGFKPSLVSYNTIVHGICKEGDSLRAYQLLEEGVRFGYSPSEFTYKILIEGLCSLSDLAKAKNILRIMLDKKTEEDKTRIYNIYVKAICLGDNPTELLNTLVTMLQTQCQPDVITLNTVIDGFCKMGRVEEALKVLRDMMSGKFCSPDAVTYTTVIDGLLAEGRDEEGLRLFREAMPKNGISPSVVTYNVVLRGLFNMRKADDAMSIFESMKIDGIAADCVTHTIIIDVLFESGRIDEAKRFWDEVVWPSGVHDTYVYSAVLKGLCGSAGRVEEACDFLYELVDCGVDLCNVNYNIVIHGACRLGLKNEVYQILGEMKKNGLSPDAVTWRILDKLHKRTGMQFCKD